MRPAVILWLLLPLAALADERILAYHSDILVRSDGVLEVTETITVRAEGRRIRRGIYRDYPTRYRDRFGNDVVAVYEPLSVLRDGRVENFRSEPYRNGVRTYFGSTNLFLEPGVYTYTYRYDADRMLGFFETHDELYWNVTGLGWEFPIDVAAASVRFEFDIAAGELDVDAFTGAFGAAGNDYRVTTASDSVRFETTAALAPGEGLTIVVGWPKGLVAEPGRVTRLVWLLKDNRDLLLALAGLLLLTFYYLPVWYQFGRDPAAGVTFTRYEPPRDFSPASLRYIRRMGYDNKTFTAAVVSLAVKGRLRIDSGDDDYTLTRTVPPADAPPLAAGEQELLDTLFAAGSSVVLDNENHARFSAARSAHKRSLARDYRQRFFKTNALMNVPAGLILVATAVVSLTVGNSPRPAVLVVLAVMLGIMVLFAWLLKRPTGIGRRVLDEIAGFREYLDIAEKEELNLRNPPEKTPALFERYLPFALALGVEQHWAERFSGVLAGLQGEDGSPYHPAWYSGSWNSLANGSYTAELSNGLDSAISSSMTAPGSSSGSGGGGFSGGGGGGGGGGGW